MATTSYYHYDALGSTRMLTDEDEAVTDSYTYDGYGNEISATGSTVNPFRYVGELGYYFDSDTGDYYVRARHYDPVISRWLSEDPIGYESSEWNLYVYTSARPLTLQDPRGEEPFCWFYVRCVGRNVQKHFEKHDIFYRGHGGNNAFAHCYVACEIHAALPFCSDEWDDRERRGRPEDKMDLINNEAGRACARSGDCWSCCYEKWEKEKLTCLNANNEFRDCEPPGDEEGTPPPVRPW